MADNEKPNDEYQFQELDPLNAEVQEEWSSASAEGGSPVSAGLSSGSNVKRNAMIAVVAFVSIMLLYKFVGAYFTGKPTAMSALPASPAVPSLVQSEPAPMVTPPPAPVAEPQPNVTSKLSDIELSQETLRSDMSGVNDQVSTIAANVDQLSNKITELNQVITALSDKLESQSRDIERLTVKPVAKVLKRPLKPVRPVLQYHVQAVIPGRAWLVASNGTALTVREGSAIAGYGHVKRIDANQGRVMTSSGRVIRFSQDDS